MGTGADRHLMVGGARLGGLSHRDERLSRRGWPGRGRGSRGRGSRAGPAAVSRRATLPSANAVSFGSRVVWSDAWRRRQRSRVGLGRPGVAPRRGPRPRSPSMPLRAVGVTWTAIASARRPSVPWSAAARPWRSSHREPSASGQVRTRSAESRTTSSESRRGPSSAPAPAPEGRSARRPRARRPGAVLATPIAIGRPSGRDRASESPRRHPLDPEADGPSLAQPARGASPSASVRAGDDRGWGAMSKWGESWPEIAAQTMGRIGRGTYPLSARGVNPRDGASGRTPASFPSALATERVNWANAPVARSSRRRSGRAIGTRPGAPRR